MLRRTSALWRTGGLIAGLLLGAAAAEAQSTFGTLTGSVTDPSGAAISGAAVTVTNKLTQAARSVVTDANGSYQAPHLDAGVYTLKFSMTGFADRARETELLARQTVRVDARLEIAAATQEVDVVAEPAVVETDSATLDNSKSGSDINSLALNFRTTNDTSPIVVATLAPTVQPDRSGAISVSGNLPFMTSFSIDGISTQRTRGGGPSRDLFPSVESIEEFKVSTANTSAEFMQVTDITTTSKSGTNAFHGSVFGFYQDSALNSVSRFAPKDPVTGEPIKPEVTGKSFGGSLGGPIVKDRTFFFLSYEGVRRPNQQTLSQLVPPDAFRSGDLSSIVRQLVDPLTGLPFPNNQIPVHPSSAQILATLYERQNQATGTRLNQPNYIVNAPGDFTVDGFDARLDQRFGDQNKIFARYTHKNVDLAGPSATLTRIPGGGAGGGNYNTKQGEAFARIEVRQLAIVHSYVASPTILNELRFGYSKTQESNGYPLAAQGGDLIRQYGFTGLPPTPASGGIPSFEFGDGTFIPTGGAKPRNILSRTYQINDNLTWIKGRHTLKAGIDFQRVEYEDQVTFFDGEEFGRYFFDGSYSGNAFADFLLGIPTFTSYAQNSPDGSPYANHYAFYVQDDWRPTPNLTVNYGLRYDIRSPMRDRSNQLGNFDRDFPGGRVVVSNEAQLAQVPPSLRAALPNTPFVTADVVGLDETLRRTDKNNFNPRLGVAWRPFGDNRTVVRGGFGMYTVPLYGSVNYSLLGVVTSDVPIFRNQRRPDGSYAIRFPNVAPAAVRAAGGAQDFRRANDFELQDPRVTQWTLTFERELGGEIVGRASYVGSKTTDIVWSPDLNQVPANTLGYSAVANTRPYRDWNVVTTRDNGSRARYDALILELNKRTRGGLGFNASYTLAYNKSDSGGAVPTGFVAENGPNVLDLFRGDSDYGDVAFTRRHRFVATFLWQVPVGKGRHFGTDMGGLADFFLGGWDLTGIGLLQSGPFLTPSFSNADPSGTGSTTRGFTSTQRPDCVGDGSLDNPTSDAYFDRAAFVRPANNIGRFGNCGVGTLIGPGTQVFSLTVGKSFKVVGASHLRFEAAFSNLFNIENLDVPGTLAITSTAFGRITATQAVDQAGPRTIQFSLRYTF